jgi:adenosylhomocysteine nucleosidase
MHHTINPNHTTMPCTPRIGILSALPEELQAILEFMPHARQECLAGRVFWVGHCAGVSVVAVVCGIGKVAAATTAALLWQRYAVTGMLFTGVAGGLAEGVCVGDVVVAESLLQHDMDASPLFPRHEVPGYGRSRFLTDIRWCRGLVMAAQAVVADVSRRLDPATMIDSNKRDPQVHQGLILSGDRFVATSAESVVLRVTHPDAVAVEMEGAAVAQVCCDLGVPLAVVRTISDRADDSAHVDFRQFVDEVARRYSVQIVKHWLVHVICD